MNEVAKTRLKKLGRFLVFKLPLIILVFGVMMIITLKLLERYSDPLRQGFEDLLSSSFHTNATIGNLDKATFFPNFEIMARNITMHDKANAGLIDMKVDSFKISTPFWSVFFNAGRLNDFQIESLTATSGFLLPYALEIDDMRIIDKEGPDQYGSFMTGSGQYKNEDLMFEIELKKEGGKYKIPKGLSFSLQTRRAEINGELEKGLTQVTLKDAVINMGKQTSSAKDYIIFKDEEFLKDNPLYCLLHADEIETCKTYMNE